MRRWTPGERAFSLLEKVKKEDGEVDDEQADIWHPDSSRERAGRGHGGGQKPVKHEPCPPGHVRNNKTGRCVNLRGAKHF